MTTKYLVIANVFVAPILIFLIFAIFAKRDRVTFTTDELIKIITIRQLNTLTHFRVTHQKAEGKNQNGTLFNLKQ